MDAQTGKPLWEAPAGVSHGTKLIIAEGIVVAPKDGRWAGFDLNTGELAWKHQEPIVSYCLSVRLMAETDPELRRHLALALLRILPNHVPPQPRRAGRGRSGGDGRPGETGPPGARTSDGQVERHPLVPQGRGTRLQNDPARRVDGNAWAQLGHPSTIGPASCSRTSCPRDSGSR